VQRPGYRYDHVRSKKFDGLTLRFMQNPNNGGATVWEKEVPLKEEKGIRGEGENHFDKNNLSFKWERSASVKIEERRIVTQPFWEKWGRAHAKTGGMRRKKGPCEKVERVMDSGFPSIKIFKGRGADITQFPQELVGERSWQQEKRRRDFRVAEGYAHDLGEVSWG